MICFKMKTDNPSKSWECFDAREATHLITTPSVTGLKNIELATIFFKYCLYEMLLRMCLTALESIQQNNRSIIMI